MARARQDEEEPRGKDVWSPQGPSCHLVWLGYEWRVERRRDGPERTAGARAQREVLKPYLMVLDLIQRKYRTHSKGV